MTTPEILKKYPQEQSYMINILHEVQDNNEDHCVHDDDVKYIAKFYQVNVAKVQGVVDYYSMFSTTPQGENIVNVCKSPVCYLKGSSNVIEMLKDKLKIDLNETTPDGLFTLRQVECLGQCDVAPMMGVNKQIYGDLDSDKLDAIIEEYKTNATK